MKNKELATRPITVGTTETLLAENMLCFAGYLQIRHNDPDYVLFYGPKGVSIGSVNTVVPEGTKTIVLPGFKSIYGICAKDTITVHVSNLFVKNKKKVYEWPSRLLYGEVQDEKRDEETSDYTADHGRDDGNAPD